MMNHHKKASLIAIGALCLLISGCSTPLQIQGKVAAMSSASSKQTPLLQPPVQNVSRIAPTGTAIEVADERLAVNIKVVDGNLYDLISKLSASLGFGVSAATGVDTQKKITAEIRAINATQAIRQLAWAAGYVAVVNDSDRSVVIANEATVVYRVPAEELKRLVSTTFKYGGSPISSSGSSSGSGSGSGSTAFTPVAADFTVEGNYRNSPQSFQAFVEQIAGSNAKVQVYLEAGLVSVRSNGQAQKRIGDFLARYAFDSRRQIEVNARVVEVSLVNEFRYGIQWDKVMNSAGFRNFSLNTRNVVGAGNAAGSLSFTTASITSVIEALESLTTVDVTSTPKLIVSNNSSGTIFEGTQKPYLPTITQTTTGSGSTGTVTLSGTGAYASDGIQLAVHASILDDENAVLTIVPSTVTLGNLNKFLEDKIQMFEQSVRNGGQRISIRSGETVVISGNRYSRANGVRTGLPGLINTPILGALASGQSKDTEARETVLIMTARILRPQPMEIIFSESI